MGTYGTQIPFLLFAKYMHVDIHILRVHGQETEKSF